MVEKTFDADDRFFEDELLNWTMDDNLQPVENTFNLIGQNKLNVTLV